MGTIRQSLTVALDRDNEGTVYVRYAYRLPSRLTDLRISFEHEFVEVDLDGFSRDGVSTYVWDSSTPRPALDFRMAADRSDHRGYTYVDRGDWALIQCPPYSLSWHYVGREVDFEEEVSLAGQGVASSDGTVMYLGPHAEHRARGAEQTFRLVVPEAASLDADPDAIFTALKFAERMLDVGCLNDEVVAVAAPSSVDWGRTGLKGGENGFWVQDTCRVDGVQNTWVHEYVHTRQGWTTHPSTDWLVEGTAEYYAALGGVRLGLVTFEEFRRHLKTPRDAGSVLVEPDRWTSRSAKYTKGRRVLAALDAALRRETGGAQCFEDVFGLLNAAEDHPLTHERFLDAVEQVGGSALRTWVTEYVEGSRSPSVPDDPAAYGLERPERPTSPPREPTDAPTEGPETVSPPEETETAPPAEDGTEAEPGPEPPEPPTEPEPTVGSEELSTSEPGTCPVCGAPIGPDDAYCDSCGTATETDCPVCGRAARGAEFCDECGSRIVQACGVCGTRRAGDQRFCPSCGTPFDE